MYALCLSVCRFDENLNNVLEPEHAATDVKMDSRLQRTDIMPLTDHLEPRSENTLC